MAFNWYSYGQAVAIEGMKADSTIDVIDSFASEDGVAPGQVLTWTLTANLQTQTMLTALRLLA